MTMAEAAATDFGAAATAALSGLSLTDASSAAPDKGGENPTSPEPSSEVAAAAAADPAISTSDGFPAAATDTDDADGKPKTWTCIEPFTRLSESIIWKLTMDFYDRKGVESWSQGIVPFFITSNAFIGRTYARLLRGFISDLAGARSDLASKMSLNPKEKMYIIELGAGAGKFSFFMLRALRELRDVLDFPLDNIVYVLTDFTVSNVRFWRDHPALRPYVESGQLDFAIFDAANDERMTLLNSGTVLGKDSPTSNPICVVANYIFDTLCHDIFHVEDGSLKEGLISVGSTKEGEPDLQDPDIIDCISNKYEYRPVDVDYYSKISAKGAGEQKSDGGSNVADVDNRVHYERLMAWYRDYYTRDDPAKLGASLMMPIGSLRALKNISNMSRGRAFVIAGDKAYTDPEPFRGIVDPHFAIHGSFSVMANFHAIGLYATSSGGYAVHNEQEDAALQVSCFVLPGVNDVPDDAGVKHFLNEGVGDLDRSRASQFPLLGQAFDDHVNSFGPSDYYALQRSMKEEASPSLSAIMSLLRMSGWDAEIFFKFRDDIISDLPHASSKLRKDLVASIPRIWSTYYELDLEKDIAFEIGRLYYGLLKYAESLKFYGISSETMGEHHVTFHNMGLCHYAMGNLDNALGYFKKAHALKPNYKKAKNWIEKVEKEMGGDESKKNA